MVEGPELKDQEDKFEPSTTSTQILGFLVGCLGCESGILMSLVWSLGRGGPSVNTCSLCRCRNVHTMMETRTLE